MIKTHGEVIHVISVDENTLPEGFKEWFIERTEEEYRDNLSNGEHMYGNEEFNTAIREMELDDDGFTEEYRTAMDEIAELMNKSDAAYVRFIKP